MIGFLSIHKSSKMIDHGKDSYVCAVDARILFNAGL